MIDDRKQMTENRWQKSDDRSQKTEVRWRKSDDRCQVLFLRNQLIQPCQL